MQERIKVKQTTPDAYKGMNQLEDFVAKSKLDPLYKELVRIRASQINGCAYCIDMHTEDARKLGASEKKIYAVSAWKESPLFSDEEKALFAFTEEVTKISERGVTDETYSNLSKYFDAESIAELIMLNVAINSWNRIAVSTHLQ
jgi:AhpD family alkylhydroperoxidase